MRISLRHKVMAGFLSILLIPAAAVMLTGIANQEGVSLGDAVPFLLALLVPYSLGALLLGRFISVNLLKPLRELNRATGYIREGQFDFKLDYGKNDEMGDLCAAFTGMSRQLKASLDAQEALERSRVELIAGISHDLRTPMTSIRGYVEGLQDGIVHDKVKFDRYIGVIKNKTESLDRLIDGLFQYTQLEMKPPGEKMKLRDSQQLLDKLLRPVELEFDDRPVLLHVVRPFPSVPLLADEDGLAQVFDNLIGNADRALGGEGKLTIAATADDRELTVSVTDDGPGIAAADLPYVFDHFYRAEKSRSRLYGGAGLGLAICRKIVQNHGGSITAESISGTGTSIRFSIPVAVSSGA